MYTRASYVFPVSIAITSGKTPILQHPRNLTAGCRHLNGPKYSKQASDLHQQWANSGRAQIIPIRSF